MKGFFLPRHTLVTSEISYDIRWNYQKVTLSLGIQNFFEIIKRNDVKVKQKDSTEFCWSISFLKILLSGREHGGAREAFVFPEEQIHLHSPAAFWGTFTIRLNKCLKRQKFLRLSPPFTILYSFSPISEWFKTGKISRAIKGSLVGFFSD